MQEKEPRRANVLAVDDKPANLITLDAVLGADFNVIRASSGPHAISILESRQDVDVILMDVQMPIMDGFETASCIKGMEGCQDIPIVFITAVYNEDPFIKQGYKAGAVDYFGKPFDPEILKLKVGIYASFTQKAHMLKERDRRIRETEALLHTGRKLSRSFERFKAGVIVTDRQGRVVHTTQEALDLWNDLAPAQRYAEGTVLGWWRRDGTLLGARPDPLARALDHCETCLDAHLEIPCADRAPRSILCCAAPLRDLDGGLVGAALVVHDATERRQIESDLETHIHRLASAGAELAPG